MSQELYHQNFSHRNDFIGPISTYDFHFLSGAPQEKKKSLALIRNCDNYVWTFLLVSIAAVSLVLIFVNKMYATLSKSPLEETSFQSMYRTN